MTAQVHMKHWQWPKTPFEHGFVRQSIARTENSRNALSRTLTTRGRLDAGVQDWFICCINPPPQMPPRPVKDCNFLSVNGTVVEAWQVAFKQAPLYSILTPRGLLGQPRPVRGSYLQAAECNLPDSPHYLVFVFRIQCH